MEDKISKFKDAQEVIYQQILFFNMEINIFIKKDTL